MTLHLDRVRRDFRVADSGILNGEGVDVATRRAVLGELAGHRLADGLSRKRANSAGVNGRFPAGWLSAERSNIWVGMGSPLSFESRSGAWRWMRINVAGQRVKPTKLSRVVSKVRWSTRI